MKILCCNFDKKKCCANCAFLCKLRYNQTIPLSEDERNQLKQGSADFLKTIKGCEIADVVHKLSCHKNQLPVAPAYGVWKHGDYQGSIGGLSKKRCDFYCPCKGNKDIPMEAIEQKQKRSMELVSIKKSNWALVVSVLALLASIVFGIANL